MRSAKMVIVSINIKNNSISERKQSHLEVCASSSQNIESTYDAGFGAIQFVHHALPELAIEELSTRITLFEKEIALPLFISCMTGGSQSGFTANRELAIAAQRAQIPLGLGSMRVLLENEERMSDFAMRPYAPTIPLFGNIGAVQLTDRNIKRLRSLIRSLDLNALVIHLNCGQELFQEGGDTDFRGLKKAIEKTVATLQIPIIVKETGFGIRPALVKELLSLGVSMVDLAGSGGTNWILVEEHCKSTQDPVAQAFANWGIPTATLLDACSAFKGKILASGGLRNGMDLAKSLALGAVAGGMALPFIQSALEGGADAVFAKIEQFTSILKKIMLLTGSKNIDALRKTALLKSSEFSHTVQSLKKIDLPT